jgi:hypothetical protein
LRFHLEQVVDGFGWVLRDIRGHAGGCEHGVEVAHEGEGFDVACRAIIQDVLNELAGEAEGAVGGVDDDSRYCAEVGVEPAVFVGRGQGGEAEDVVADVERESGVREDGDGGQLRGKRGPARGHVEDLPDGGEGGGAGAAVVEAGEGVVIMGVAGEEGEGWGGRHDASNEAIFDPFASLRTSF